jgi:phosphoglycolate phosphatase-like HAD superfamily hydrolase
MAGNRNQTALALLDVDGTLTDSNRMDEVYYLEALAAMGIREVNSDWSAYPDSNDAAIFNWLFRDRFGREPQEVETARFRADFVGRLRLALAEDPGLCRPIPGAQAMLDRVRREPAWRAAIATGAWIESARVKLAAAGLDVAGIPLATATDAGTRAEILGLARERAGRLHRGAEFRRTVSVGDARWDVRVARKLGLPFIGIAHGEREKMLRAEGAETIVPDFSDLDGFIRLLDQARPPRREGRNNDDAT